MMTYKILSRCYLNKVYKVDTCKGVISFASLHNLQCLSFVLFHIIYVSWSPMLCPQAVGYGISDAIFLTFCACFLENY